MLVRLRYVIPLLGRPERKALPDSNRTPLAHALAGTLTTSDERRLIAENERRSRRFAFFKPQRTLGAPWIDNFVSRGMSVSLCEDCLRKYGKWWRKYEYKAVWSPKELTDCDGCSRHLLYCIGFYPVAASTPWAHRTSQ